MHFRFLLPWYDKVLKWSKHPKACWYLGLVSFIDASLFPLSPLFMVLPMSFSNPARAFHFAAIVIVTSFVGGMIGYSLGLFAFEALISPFIHWMGYATYYEMAMHWFHQWGFAAILFGCLTPFIPYKIFTIGAGVMQLNFGGFLLASLLGRILRFLLIASIIRWGGPKVEPVLRRTLTKISNYQPG
jgi:membrane protein YqaA with SNARE-associated domain